MRSKCKIYIWVNLHFTDCIRIWLLKHTNLLSLMFTWFLTCWPPNPDHLIFSYFNYDESPNIKRLNGWIILPLGRHILRESSISVFTIWGSFWKKSAINANIMGVADTHVVTVKIQPGEFSHISINVIFIQPCDFHIIFLILWFLLAVDSSPATWTRLRFIYGICTIIYDCLSISYQLCCKIKPMYFWLNLDGRFNFLFSFWGPLLAFHIPKYHH